MQSGAYRTADNAASVSCHGEGKSQARQDDEGLLGDLRTPGADRIRTDRENRAILPAGRRQAGGSDLHYERSLDR